MSLEALVKLFTDSPRARFNITEDPGFTIFDLGSEYEINPEEFLSMGKATPFKGHKVHGKCLATIYQGRAAYIDEEYFGGKANG